MATTTETGQGDFPSEKLRRLLLKENFRQALVWLKDSRCRTGEPFSEERGEEHRGKPKSASARQDEQTVRDKANGWRRCYAKAWDTPEARAIVSSVAKATEFPFMVQAIRLVIDHPESVFIGEKVRTLRGVRGVIVRRLIGAIDVGISG